MKTIAQLFDGVNHTHPINLARAKACDELLEGINNLLSKERCGTITELQTVKDNLFIFMDSVGYNGDVKNGDDIDNLVSFLSSGYIADDAQPVNIKTIFVAADEGGYEGGGEERYYVFGLVYQDDKVVYLRVDGIYDSWNGVEWHGEHHIVTPKIVPTMEWM